MPLLCIKNLKIAFPTRVSQNGFLVTTAEQEIVHGIDITIAQGQIIGLVGESGSGKSVSALSILHLLPEGTRISAEEMTFDGSSLLSKREEEWQQLRGNRIAMVFQEPMTSLNPVLTIEAQVEEGLLIHEAALYKTNKKLRRERVLQVLSEAGLENPEELLEKYPHQLSGGMRQRVMIAIAMLHRPQLLIADEPTTALDAATQEIIIGLLKYYRDTYQTSILFISHDLVLVARLCDRVLVLKDGRVAEHGTTEEIFSRPKEAYTKKLLEAADGKRFLTQETSQNHRVPVLSVNQAVIEYKEKTLSLIHI